MSNETSPITQAVVGGAMTHLTNVEVEDGELWTVIGDRASENAKP